MINLASLDDGQFKDFMHYTTNCPIDSVASFLVDDYVFDCVVNGDVPFLVGVK